MVANSYFNLSGAPSITGTEVSLSSSSYLTVTNGIPNSVKPATYAGISPNKAFTLGPSEPDIDDCFIVSPFDPSVPLDTRSSPLNTLVSAYHPDTKIHLEVLSTEPAFQFYTGKYIDVPEIKGDDGKIVAPARGARSGFCVEPSRYVNAINVPEWKDQVLLKKGEVYGSRIVYKGWDDE
jgi:aldose 1-epimerase